MGTAGTNGSTDKHTGELSLTKVFEGKRVLFVGSTGFVGKVALSMFLHRYPGIGKMFVLVRPGAGSSAEDRFFRKVVASPVFDPLRQTWGAGFDAFLRDKCRPIPGDVSRPMMNFDEAILTELSPLDCIINCAGLVSFNPTLESAIRINVHGVKNTLDVARRTGASVVHVSTCFVAGNRDGEIWEDEPVVGYFPRKRGVQAIDRDSSLQSELRDEDFNATSEVADCEKLIEQVRARADDRAHISEFRDRAAAYLRAEGRDADDERVLRIGVQRERKMWMAKQLTDLGMERAQHWGWPNTYTYTKSLGDQFTLAAEGVRTCIVRPAIVESSLAYPFEGWNEGFTTSAPLAMLTLKGHRNYPIHGKASLDLIPVDMVAAGLIAATGATIAGQNQPVYQLASGDVNPFSLRRAIELLGIYKRRYYREREAGTRWLNRVLARLEPTPVSRDTYQTQSAPRWNALAKRVTKAIDDLTPRWGAPRLQGLADRVKDKLSAVEDLTGKTDELFQLFMPFIWERDYVFRCDSTRALFARLAPEDRLAIPWTPDKIDWRHYWLDVHMNGLEKWVFPSLEEEFEQKPRSFYTYKDLLEMFDATTKHHKSRVALRQLPEPKAKSTPDQGREPTHYTYADMQELALRSAASLRQRGVTPGDRVMLLSENRPEWGITYFGVLKAGAIVVPVDAQLPLGDLVNILRSSRARVAVVSDKQAIRLAEDAGGNGKSTAAAGRALLETRAREANLECKCIPFEDTLGEPAVSPGALVHQPKGDDIASLIYTSGTTGNPKGVMLSHRNFSSLISKLAGVFDLNRHDGLLSVLPLHHTLEFAAGLLMPLMRGAQVSYMAETSTEALQEAFDEGGITGMVGVPALWQLLERKIEKQFSDRGPWWARAFRGLTDANRWLRDNSPVDLNLGKLAFWPIHKRLGGRMRLLISGGSALPTDTLKRFRGMGFSLFEGYGLTEASPVLTVARPGKRLIPGSVGEALPGIEVKIDSPDASGVGEVIAQGPNVMLGYYENPEATAEVVKDGWLHTGDLGRIDEEKRLFIVGRRKEMILAANGENVYPDELEDVYRDSPYVKELSIVGLPADAGDGAGGGEIVACLVVPDYEAKKDGDKLLARELVRERVLEHVRNVSAKLPLYKRIKVVHLWDFDLPKTATRKAKRRQIVEEIKKLERAKQAGAAAAAAGGGAGAAAGSGSGWLVKIVADLTGKPAARVTPDAQLSELGFDSLMYTELGVALEAAGVDLPDAADLTGIATFADLDALVRSRKSKGDKRDAERRGVTIDRARPRDVSADADEIVVPKLVARLGRRALTFGQRMLYERLLDTRVTGKAHIPAGSSFIVAANHASHLDMGLVKHALGEWGPSLVALAAKDYFFEDPVKRAYFENFTNLVPMDRFGSLRESLRLAGDVLRQGYILLIFPEGTRSETGVMTDFKPSLGYLALANKIDVLPMYLEGTHDAMPKGRVLPTSRATIAAHIGPLMRYDKLKAASEKVPKVDQYREVSRLVEKAVRQMMPAKDRARQHLPAQTAPVQAPAAGTSDEKSEKSEKEEQP